VVDASTNPSSDEDRRDWARPDPEGDPWHQYWDPAESPEADDRRARLTRIRTAVYLISAPTAVVLSLIIGTPYSAAVSCLSSIGAVIRIRVAGQRSRAFLFTGLAFTLVLAVIATVRIVPYLHGDGGAFALRTGDCFNRPETGAGTGFETGKLVAVACTQPHNAEIVGSASAIDESATSPTKYPGTTRLSGLAATRCHSVSRAYVLDPLSLPPGTQLRWYLPREPQWQSNASIVCVLAADQPTLTRSVREDATDVDDAQLDFLVAIRDFDDAVSVLDSLGPAPSWKDLRPALEAAAEAHGTMWNHLVLSSWPSTVAPDMTRLTSSVQAADAVWQQASGATDPADALGLVSRARAQADPTLEMAVRRGLGLSTVQGEPVHRQ
jgi:hypothetical protein